MPFLPVLSTRLFLGYRSPSLTWRVSTMSSISL
ncbi:unnamed protein product [Callosobruchus maculatus]|uniref:Uncharacterized protein n=1 Tax=Callosobruchus maculatus TaxID=64391 RepID=A0A653DS54_CALMS|nr:unnamed protein product [Callosobruchus maculatus]